MRTGFLASASAHAVLIAVGLMSLGAAEPLRPEVVESIAVDLVPLSAISSVRAGTIKSEVVETETPAVVESDKPAELAQKAGNTEQDQPRPTEAAAPTPAPTLNTAPEPVPEPAPAPEPPQPAPQPEPEPAPPPAAPELMPEPAPAPPTPTPELAAPPTPEPPAEVAPKPVVRTASLEEKRAAYKKAQEELARQAADEAKKKKEAEQKAAEAKKKEEEARKAAEARKKQEEAARRADAVAAIINSETSRGAVTGQGGTPTLGKPTGQSPTLSQSEMSALMAALKDCLFLPTPIDDGSTARLVITFDRNRAVISQQLIGTVGEKGALVAQAAERAVGKCAAQNRFTMLAAETYDQWKQVDVTFDPSQMF